MYDKKTSHVFTRNTWPILYLLQVDKPSYLLKRSAAFTITSSL